MYKPNVRNAKILFDVAILNLVKYRYYFLTVGFNAKDHFLPGFQFNKKMRIIYYSVSLSRYSAFKNFDFLNFSMRTR